MPARRDPFLGATIKHLSKAVGRVEEITEDGWVCFGWPGSHRTWERVENIGGQAAYYYVGSEPAEEPAG